MKKTFNVILSLLLLPASLSLQAGDGKADLVDMYMGVQGSSNCVIGPQVPHGSVNPAPQTPNGGHNGYGPNEPIRGFGQLHVSGIGWARYGQIFLSPQTGFNAREDGHDSPKSDETARPYYYSVNLERYGIRTEVVPTRHCAFYRFTYPQTNNANLLLDVAHSVPQHIVPIVRGRFHGGEINYNEADNTLTGWGEYSGGFGNDIEPYKVYYCIALDRKPAAVKVTGKGDKALYAQIRWERDPGEVQVRVGISMRDVENAVRYVQDEVAGRTFDAVMADARQAWEDVFASIKVKGGSGRDERMFYTAMYHSFVMPRERTGDNPNWTSTLPHIDDHFCVWDTWRTTYPLLTIINESFVTKTINSFIDRRAHQGVVRPTYTSSQIWDWKQGGDDVDNIIADAFVKNVPGFNRRKAYELIRFNAFSERDTAYRAYGWMPEPARRMSVSYTMEYAYNDFCAAQVARAMNDLETADILAERSGEWANVFNPQLESHGFKGFACPRKGNGEWIAIDPAQRYGSWVEYFYEGNSWVYTLFAPHQFDRLIELCGGKDEMTRRLCYGFDHNLIELDNEPGFLSPFIFTHCGRPDLTAKYVDKIRTGHFSLETGYPDNEDSGAMGAWYIFSSIGFFPNAGQDFYYLLPPAFPDITITRENGKQIRIKTAKASPDARYIQSVTVNGKTLDRPYIRHAEIAEGATIEYVLK